MPLWDILTGQKSKQPRSDSADLSKATPTTTASTTSSSTAFDSPAPDVSSFLNDVTLQDPSRLHPLAGLDKDALEYLSLEETALSDLPGSQSGLPSRGFSDDLCYGTGVTYLSALTIGGTWGLAEGLRRSPTNAPPRLKLNAVLNSITRRGPFLGNSAGMIALVYNLFNGTLVYFRGRHDAFNSVTAGALSGMLFKSTRGLRPMLISGGIVAGVAGTWALIKKTLIQKEE